jgi:hypothetical protein
VTPPERAERPSTLRRPLVVLGRRASDRGGETPDLFQEGASASPPHRRRRSGVPPRRSPHRARAVGEERETRDRLDETVGLDRAPAARQDAGARPRVRRRCSRTAQASRPRRSVRS